MQSNAYIFGGELIFTIIKSKFYPTGENKISIAASSTYSVLSLYYNMFWVGETVLEKSVKEPILRSSLLLVEK